MLKRLILVVLLFCACALRAQGPADLAADEGIWEGYDGEWRYVSRLLLSMAEAIPADKYGWRPQPGVRSASEVLMHIAQSNYYLLSVTGPKMPSELASNDVEKRSYPSRR